MSGGTTVADCRVVPLPRIARREGQITPVEGGREVPFEIARAYYLYDIPGGETRGGHAHLALEQLIVSVMGSFDVLLDDGERKRIITLNRAYQGLLMPRMIWRELLNFSSGAVCLVLASLPYEEADYVRDYSHFLALKR